MTSCLYSCRTRYNNNSVDLATLEGCRAELAQCLSVGGCVGPTDGVHDQAVPDVGRDIKLEHSFTMLPSEDRRLSVAV